MSDFATQDMNLAAFIWAQPSAKLIKLRPKQDKLSKNVFDFVFTLDIPVESLNNLLLDYQNGKALVEPSLFIQKQNYLRDQIRSASRG